jgi:hypothetical protein
MEQTKGKTIKSTSAAHVIAGFRYQILHSLAALMILKDDEKLLLECDEDFSVISDNVSTDVQVKGSQAVAGPRPFSLQSPEVRSAIRRFWEASETGSGTEHRLIFLARGGAAVEKEYLFPGNIPGLIHWKAAAIDADTTSLRIALETLFADHSLGIWLRSKPNDSELRERLLRRITWQLEEQAADSLVVQAKDQLAAICRRRNLPVRAANQMVDSLISLVFEVAANPDPKDRSLSLLDLYRVMEDVVGTSLVAQAMAGRSTITAEDSQDILISEVVGARPYQARRTNTLAEIIEKTRGQSLVWLFGSHGVGKSILAQLMAQSLGGRWLVLDLRPVQKDSKASIGAWRDLLNAVSLGDPPTGVIVDDFGSEGEKFLWPRLSALVGTLSARGARIIVTSNHEPSPSHFLEFGSGATNVIQVPYFSEIDIAELVRFSPAPDASMVEAWSLMIRLTTGGGQPVLAAAKIASLRARGWPNAALTEDMVSVSPAVKLTREGARRSLLNDLRELDEARSLDAAQLLRRVASIFDRAEESLVYALANKSPSLRSGSDVLAILRGTWLEILPKGDLRISPLLADIASDLPPEEVKTYRRIAAEHWIAKKSLDERTLPLCFWNAYLGEESTTRLHGKVLRPLADSWRELAVVEAELAVSIGIDKRSMTKQHRQLPANFELQIRATRYATILQSQDVEGMLRAGIDLLHASKLYQEAEIDTLGVKRIEEAKLNQSELKKLITEASVAESIPLILLDVLLAQSIEGKINTPFLVDFALLVSKVFGNTPVIEKFMRIVFDPRLVAKNATRYEALATGISLHSVEVESNPSNRFIRDLMIVDHLNFSFIKSKMTSRVVAKLAEGWKFVVDRQRFLLRSPGSLVPLALASVGRMAKNPSVPSPSVAHWRLPD